jgi:hypothetical protein
MKEGGEEGIKEYEWRKKGIGRKEGMAGWV